MSESLIEGNMSKSYFRRASAHPLSGRTRRRGGGASRTLDAGKLGRIDAAQDYDIQWDGKKWINNAAESVVAARRTDLAIRGCQWLKFSEKWMFGREFK